MQTCQLWTLDRRTFRNALATKELQQKAERVGLLRNIKLFEKLSQVTLGQIAEAVTSVTYPAGQKIIKQGDVRIMMHLTLRYLS